MNHTGVDTFRLSQVVKDEANRFLDAAEIGTDDEFVVCATEILSRHEFESRATVACLVQSAKHISNSIFLETIIKFIVLHT